MLYWAYSPVQGFTGGWSASRRAPGLSVRPRSVRPPHTRGLFLHLSENSLLSGSLGAGATISSDMRIRMRLNLGVVPVSALSASFFWRDVCRLYLQTVADRTVSSYLVVCASWLSLSGISSSLRGSAHFHTSEMRGWRRHTLQVSVVTGRTACWSGLKRPEEIRHVYIMVSAHIVYLVTPAVISFEGFVLLAHWFTINVVQTPLMVSGFPPDVGTRLQGRAPIQTQEQ